LKRARGARNKPAPRGRSGRSGLHRPAGSRGSIAIFTFVDLRQRMCISHAGRRARATSHAPPCAEMCHQTSSATDSGCGCESAGAVLRRGTCGNTASARWIRSAGSAVMLPSSLPIKVSSIVDSVRCDSVSHMRCRQRGAAARHRAAPRARAVHGVGGQRARRRAGALAAQRVGASFRDRNNAATSVSFICVLRGAPAMRPPADRCRLHQNDTHDTLSARSTDCCSKRCR
jgi:hypothetical protein